MGIGEQLKDFFKEKGLSQNDIARDLGVSTAYVNALLNGKKTFGKRQASVFAEKYGLSKSFLLTGIGDITDNHKMIEVHVSGGSKTIIGDGQINENSENTVRIAVLEKENEMLREQIELLKTIVTNK